MWHLAQDTSQAPTQAVPDPGAAYTTVHEVQEFTVAHVKQAASGAVPGALVQAVQVVPVLRV